MAPNDCQRQAEGVTPYEPNASTPSEAFSYKGQQVPRVATGMMNLLMEEVMRTE